MNVFLVQPMQQLVPTVWERQVGDVSCCLTLLIVDWKEGAFNSFLTPGASGKLFGFWACCCQAVFSYVGGELVGIAADETERQRETLPRAVRRISYRLVFYYAATLFVLGLNVSAKDPILKSYLAKGIYASPFVLMIQRAGIPGLPDVINALALIAVLSVANADLYVSVLVLVNKTKSRVELCMPLLWIESGNSWQPKTLNIKSHGYAWGFPAFWAWR
jgi:amino acid permease